MRVLLVSWYFPPANTVAAVRTGKLARFLLDQGIEVRVLTAGARGLPETLPLEIPPSLIRATRWRDLGALPAVLRRRPTRQGDAPAAVRSEARGGSWRKRLGSLHRDLVTIPDRQAGWLPHALAAGRALIADWHPDLVYASAPPFTGLLVAARLARRAGVPWIAELRDRWVDDSFVPRPPWRRRLDGWIERRTLGAAAALVTVSDVWAAELAAKHDRPVATIANGFDPADFPDGLARPAGTGPLVILHAGTIYPGHRDPTPLFQAVRHLGLRTGELVIRFLGATPAEVMPLAAATGVAPLVEAIPRVSYRESVAALCQADILLLLQHDSPSERGNVPAKLFEYLAARRPVLGLGPRDGIPARLLAARGAGQVCSTVEAIVPVLHHWLRARQRGGIPDLPPSVVAGLTRAEQFARLLPLMQAIRPVPAPAARPSPRPLGDPGPS